jgi:hypothetical protein
MACQRENILKMATHFCLVGYALGCTVQRSEGKLDDTGLQYCIPRHRYVYRDMGLLYASRAPRYDCGKKWKGLRQLDWACGCLYLSDCRSDSQLHYSGKHYISRSPVLELTYLQYREAVKKMNLSNDTNSSSAMMDTLWSGDVKVELN